MDEFDGWKWIDYIDYGILFVFLYMYISFHVSWHPHVIDGEAFALFKWRSIRPWILLKVDFLLEIELILIDKFNRLDLIQLHPIKLKLLMHYILEIQHYFPLYYILNIYLPLHENMALDYKANREVVK